MQTAGGRKGSPRHWPSRRRESEPHPLERPESKIERTTRVAKDGGNWAPPLRRRERKTVKLPWKTVWRLLQNVARSHRGPRQSHASGTHAKGPETDTVPRPRPHAFTAAASQQPTGSPSTSRAWAGRTTEHHAAVKRHGILTGANGLDAPGSHTFVFDGGWAETEGRERATGRSRAPSRRGSCSPDAGLELMNPEVLT